MGVVWRVQDPELGRNVALKVMRPQIQASTQAIQRFNTEARLTAQLQHPAVVPVYEAGRLPDGRLYFTMKEIRGTTLRQVIATKHLRLRRQLDALVRVCQAVAYAHSRGVIHRDIKPDNIMIGEFGEVMVVDWGVARLLAEVQTDGEGLVGLEDTLQTQVGALIGTPAYMAPELIEGAPSSPASDIYALGAVLFDVLAGLPRYSGHSAELFDRILAGEGEPLPPDAPPGLQLACERAMSAAPEDRYPDAGALAEAISDWLDGVRLRDQAMACVDKAEALQPRIAELTTAASVLRAQAAALLEGVRSYDPVERKKPAWKLEDQADALEREARQASLTAVQQLHAALNILPTLPEAHARLAAHYHQQHAAAEQRNDTREAEQLEGLLRQHDRRRRFAAYLTGDGALSLVTDPPGVTVALHRIAEVERRLTPIFERLLGTTPLLEVALPRGRYLLVLSAPGYHEVRYPVTVGRLEHWHGTPPGERAPAPIWMPPAGSLSAGECYVPAGWFVAGGDAEALDALPWQRVWADGFIIREHPITIGEYRTFLRALSDEERVQHMPTTMSGHPQLLDEHLHTAAPWSDLHPITMVSGRMAMRYARWCTAGGHAWRLPEDLEWEKAARGVDGRSYPWGELFEPTWACTQLSHQGTPWIAPVSDYPGDVSLYGVRGAAGNTSEWSQTHYRKSGSTHLDERFFVVRGGSFQGTSRTCRLASRTAGPTDRAFFMVGFRLLRSIAPSSLAHAPAQT